jgi:hypothetical protein
MRWTVGDVLRWLDGVLELPGYQHKFRKASVDGPVLLRLNGRDLQRLLGVAHPLHQRKIMDAVQVLRKGQWQVEVLDLNGLLEPDLPGATKVLGGGVPPP